MSLFLIILNIGKASAIWEVEPVFDSWSSIIAYISFINFIIGLFSFLKLRYKINHNCSDSDFRVTGTPLKKDFDFIPTMATLLSFVTFNGSDFRGLIYYIFLLLFVFLLFLKTDYFYASPFLAVLGYKVYILEGFKDGNIVKVFAISKDEICTNDVFKYKVITNSLVCGYKHNSH